MSELAFQKALFHLYLHIEEWESYPDVALESFALSRSERQALRELVTLQRPALLAYNRQLRFKQLRYIRHALPKSLTLIGDELNRLIEDYISSNASEGSTDITLALRSFSDHLNRKILRDETSPKVLEFVRFEAAYASLVFARTTTLNVSSTSKPARWMLPDAETHVYLSSSYDVLPSFLDPSAALITEEKRLYYLLFKDRYSNVRFLKIGPDLFRLLELLGGGSSVGAVLNTLESDRDREEALGTIERLISLGVPFRGEVGVGPGERV